MAPQASGRHRRCWGRQDPTPATLLPLAPTPCKPTCGACPNRRRLRRPAAARRGGRAAAPPPASRLGKACATSCSNAATCSARPAAGDGPRRPVAERVAPAPHGEALPPRGCAAKAAAAMARRRMSRGSRRLEAGTVCVCVCVCAQGGGRRGVAPGPRVEAPAQEQFTTSAQHPDRTRHPWRRHRSQNYSF